MRFAVIALVVLAGCYKRHEPSAEYRAAVNHFEQTIADTQDFDYTHERFDDVLDELARVPDGDRDAANALAEDIRNKRAAAAARARVIDDEIGAAKRAAQRATERAGEPAREVLPPGWDDPDAPPPNLPGERPRPRPAAGGADERAAAFDRAAAEARQKRLREEAERARTKVKEERAETKRKMEERLQQKLDERMNEEVDPSKWKCNQLTGRCTTEVTVTEDEVK